MPCINVSSRDGRDDRAVLPDRDRRRRSTPVAADRRRTVRGAGVIADLHVIDRQAIAPTHPGDEKLDRRARGGITGNVELDGAASGIRLRGEDAVGEGGLRLSVG